MNLDLHRHECCWFIFVEDGAGKHYSSIIIDPISLQCEGLMAARKALWEFAMGTISSDYRGPTDLHFFVCKRRPFASRWIVVESYGHGEQHDAP